MYDQASKLRQIINENFHRQNQKSASVRVYSVTSGKGGVGKTNLSVNMAIVLQSLGKRVLLIDADLGLANVDVVAGLYPKYNISHIVNSGSRVNDVIIDGPMGIKVLPGASGIYDLANLTGAELNQLIEAFKSIATAFDIIIIDTGAGISKNVISFVQSSDEAIVVTTPEPSAVTDAYAVIKLIHKCVDRIHIIVNRADNFKEADFTAQKICNASQKFLNTTVYYLGFVLEDRTVYLSNMKQVPFYINYPNGLASKCISNIGKKLLYGGQIPAEGNKTVESWFRKLVSYITNEARLRGGW
jgi:flagellar biosynthesis protein FlhG